LSIPSNSQKQDKVNIGYIELRDEEHRYNDEILKKISLKVVQDNVLPTRIDHPLIVKSCIEMNQDIKNEGPTRYLI
jgi:hypothetical protein